MPESLRAPVFSLAREAVGDVELAASVFDAPRRKHLLYETVRMQLANRRAGTHATKTRAFVRGGGAKPWKQKGTGRARSGSSRSPVWVGGATVFGPQPRDYSYRLPASARREALRVALSGKQREGRLLVVDRFEVESGKTRDAASVLSALQVSKALIVVAEVTPELRRAVKNLPLAKVIDCAGLNVYDLLRYEALVVTVDALERIQERRGS
jgi:large subunit ribosomal protein L4